ncbi:CLUMA_CG003876, isoform A [Clunio marinus]|uniref:CLUMA_CG003876, isoform A n=1 Tax=Clunio marinus TaxID=568069 RepID=A0A1J1HVH8_9DIPT|nr:CLUMA_CG003876, isoform A [Clunio marinus]
MNRLEVFIKTSLGTENNINCFLLHAMRFYDKQQAVAHQLRFDFNNQSSGSVMIKFQSFFFDNVLSNLRVVSYSAYSIFNENSFLILIICFKFYLVDSASETCRGNLFNT